MTEVSKPEGLLRSIGTGFSYLGYFCFWAAIYLAAMEGFSVWQCKVFYFFDHDEWPTMVFHTSAAKEVLEEKIKVAERLEKEGWLLLAYKELSDAKKIWPDNHRLQKASGKLDARIAQDFQAGKPLFPVQTSPNKTGWNEEKIKAKEDEEKAKTQKRSDENKDK